MLASKKNTLAFAKGALLVAEIHGLSKAALNPEPKKIVTVATHLMVLPMVFMIVN